jgi:hypothetical protein
MRRGVLLLALVLAAAARAAWLPIKAETNRAGDGVLIATIPTGDPARARTFVLDFTRGDVRVMYDAGAASRAYTALYGAAHDLYGIGGAPFMLQTSVELLDTAALCRSCEGVLGLGPTSPVWSKFRGPAQITAREITFDDGGAPAADADCALAAGALCATTSTLRVGPHAFGPYPVEFTLNASRMEIPLDAYATLIARRHVSSTPSYAWPALCFDWACIYPAQYLYNAPLAPRLRIQASTDGVVRLTGSALLSMQVTRHWSGGVMGGVAVREFPVALQYSWWMGAVVAALAALFPFARMLPPAWEHRIRGPVHHNVLIAQLIDVCGAVIPVAATLYVGADLLMSVWIVPLALFAAHEAIAGACALFTMWRCTDTPADTETLRNAGAVADVTRDLGLAWAAAMFAAQVRSVRLASLLGTFLAVDYGIAAFAALVTVATVLRRPTPGFVLWALTMPLAVAVGAAIVGIGVVEPQLHSIEPSGSGLYFVAVAAGAAVCAAVFAYVAAVPVRRVLEWEPGKFTTPVPKQPVLWHTKQKRNR